MEKLQESMGANKEDGTQSGEHKGQGVSMRRVHVVSVVLGILLVACLVAFSVVLYLTMQKINAPEQGSVNGNWGSWTNVSGCTHSCGGGTRYRIRMCNNPSPSFGGDWCAGISTDFQPCNTDTCPDYRSAFSVRVPADGPTNGTIRLFRTILNQGNHYDTALGKFTPQQPGVYVFHLNIQKNRGENFARCCIRQNGIIHVCASTDPDLSSDPGQYKASNTVLLYLGVGDIVDLGDCTSASTMNGDFFETTFSGFLLYPST